jgi:hypothetical protein
VHFCFLSDRLVSKERYEDVLVVTIIWHDFSSMVKSHSAESHRGQDPRTRNGGSILCGEMELAW